MLFFLLLFNIFAYLFLLSLPFTASPTFSYFFTILVHFVSCPTFQYFSNYFILVLTFPIRLIPFRVLFVPASFQLLVWLRRLRCLCVKRGSNLLTDVLAIAGTRREFLYLFILAHTCPCFLELSQTFSNFLQLPRTSSTFL